MKTAFNTKFIPAESWNDYVAAATDSKLGGIVIGSVRQSAFRGKSSPTNPELSLVIRRRMTAQKLEIPCIDTQADFMEDHSEEVREAVEVARNLQVPYVIIHTETGDVEAAEKGLEGLLSMAERYGIVLLFETSGPYSDTAKLRDILNYFASDNLAACWNMHDTCFVAGEDPETTIRNLGAYVKHVSIHDAVRTPDGEVPELIGDGNLPLKALVNALRSVNFDGYVSLVWDPDWISELPDIEVVFSHFVDCMSRFRSPSRKKKTLYRNKAGTGEFLWKKEALIDMTFSQVLEAQVEEFPDQIAIRYTTLDYTRTYAEFREDVDEFARSLMALGVKPGCHVAVWATNIPQWFIAFWATVKIGAVLVTVNTAYKIHEAEYLLRQSDTHTLILIDGYRDSNYAEIIRQLCPEMETNKPGKPLHCKRLPFLRNIITVGFRLPGCLTWDEAVERSGQVSREELRAVAAGVNAHDVCNMQYTSGTTGFPKGVMLTHYNIINNGKCIGDRMDLSTADRLMIQVPMFHCFGMVLAMTAAMTHGASIYPLPYFSPKPALACIHKEHITAFHGVPTMFIALLEHPDFAKTDFSHVRTGIMAGSPCPITVMRDVCSKMNMKEITIVFGQTEASPGCTMSSTDDPLEVRVETVGRPLPEIECKIVNPETGEDCPDGVTGEFVARGYNIMKGYYKMPKATMSAIDKDGWLHTGDLACRTPDGNFKITGRLKDMIIRGGENIYPKEIEEFIYTHPKVRDVQVVGVPDEAMGEEIMAWVILKDGARMDQEELQAYVRANMAKHKVPRYVAFVDSFPMNVAGKILKYKMREMAVEMLGLQKAAAIETA